MKQPVLVLVLLTAIGLVMAAAQEQEEKMGLDVGGELTMGFYDTDDELLGFFATLFSMRAGVFGDFTLALGKNLAVGAEAGVMTMQVEVNGESTTFVDIPLRAIGRYSTGPLFVQPHVGPYLAFGGDGMDFYLDVGAKLGFGKKTKLFAEVAYLLGPINYFRVGGGLAFNVLNF